MQVTASYREILRISYPLILASLAQNLIGITDVIFLGRVGEVELGAGGLMAIYYLVLQMLGYGISRGGQIIIARRAGQGRADEIGNVMVHLFGMEMILALLSFLFMQWVSPALLHYFITSPETYEAALSYLYYRSFGIFFSFWGFTLMAFYTGISRTPVIGLTMSFLFLTNIVFNYGLVFGNLGMPKMGIAGSALASTLAEIVLTAVGLIYIFLDKKLRNTNLFANVRYDPVIFRGLSALSFPLILQYVVSLGGWFVLFTFIESMGQRALAASTVLKQLYSFFTIPAWGLASATNALVSNLIGQERPAAVLPALNRIVRLSVLLTVALLPVLFLFQYPLLYIFTSDPNIVESARGVLPVLAVVVLVCAVSTVVFNALLGTGHIMLSLIIQTAVLFVYLGTGYLFATWLKLSLPYVWTSEIIYWIALWLPTILYLRSHRWEQRAWF